MLPIHFHYIARRNITSDLLRTNILDLVTSSCVEHSLLLHVIVELHARILIQFIKNDNSQPTFTNEIRILLLNVTELLLNVPIYQHFWGFTLIK